MLGLKPASISFDKCTYIIGNGKQNVTITFKVRGKDHGIEITRSKTILVTGN